MNKFDYKNLLDEFIDDYIEKFGLKSTIQFLLDKGATKKQLVEDLYFSQCDVEDADCDD